jgi:hypothetical protein
MKVIISLLFMVILTACNSTSSSRNNDEGMSDLALDFKELSQSADAYLKFDLPPEELDSIDDHRLLVLLKERMPQKFAPLRGYQIEAQIQGSNVVMLLCDSNSNVALMEDAGCNYRLDKALWKLDNKTSCDFTIDTGKYCE